MDKVTQTLIDLALEEDIREGDVTSKYFVPKERQVGAKALVKAPGRIAGLEIAQEVFRRVDDSLSIKLLAVNGDEVVRGDYVMDIFGSAQSILTAERTALNFLQRLSGIATNTSRYVEAVSGTKAQVLDTRKTTPGWRVIEKAAVKAGGGTNHRMGLYDRAMVKDNHLIAASDLGELQKAIDALKAEKPQVEIELEADRLDQVKDFLSLTGVDYILLDNMSLAELREAVSLRGESGPALEASGGVTLETISEIAQTEVDFISVGALTHSAIALDISLDFYETE